MRIAVRDLEAVGFGTAELVMIDAPRHWPQCRFKLVVTLLKKGQQEDCKFGKLG